MLVTKNEINGFLIGLEMLKITGGDTSLWLDVKAMSRNIGIEGRDFELGIGFLLRKGLVTGYGAGYTYFLSEFGIDEITKAVKFPNNHTDSFPCLEDLKAVLKANGRVLEC